MIYYRKYSNILFKDCNFKVGSDEKSITKTAFKAFYRFNNNNHTDDMVVLFILYGICCQQGVSGSAVCGSYIAFALYCQQADENVYKNVMDIFDTECSNRGYSMLFLFRQTGAYVKDARKNGKNRGGICTA